jgi:hypothetical protein
MLTYMRTLLSRVTFKGVLLFTFLAGFAEQEAAVLRWALTLVLNVRIEPALQGLRYSAIGVLANAALIWGSLLLLRSCLKRNRSAPVPIEVPPGGRDRADETDPTVPVDPVDHGEAEPAKGRRQR